MKAGRDRSRTTPSVISKPDRKGPIHYAFDDGRVHARSDALQIAEFSSERRASRFAAQIGYCAGLKILIASDW